MSKQIGKITLTFNELSTGECEIVLDIERDLRHTSKTEDDRVIVITDKVWNLPYNVPSTFERMLKAYIRTEAIDFS